MKIMLGFIVFLLICIFCIGILIFKQLCETNIHLGHIWNEMKIMEGYYD